jgi:hypothetical protein
MTTETIAPMQAAQAEIMQTVIAFFRTRTMQVFAELCLADDIAAGRVPAVDPRFLQACEAIGLLRSLPGGQFELTPAGDILRSDVPGSMRAFAACAMGGAHYKAWSGLADSVRTGACAFDATHGEDVWSYFTKTNPAEGHLFNQAMAGSSAAIVDALLAHYDFPYSGTFIDIAGGDGSLLSAVLKTRPSARGVVMDLPFTQPAAEARIAAAGLADRCSFVPGDFFHSVPAGGDLYTMKWILHDWSDIKAAAILRNIHAAMPAAGKLLLVEAVVPEGDGGLFGRMMDINMMVMCGGKERTEAQWRALLSYGGFSLSRVISMPAPVSLIEAVKR